MKKNPSKVIELYHKSKLNEDEAIKNLIFIISNSNSENDRLTAFKYMEEFSRSILNYYHFIEELIISDSNENIRILAAVLLCKYFQNKAIEPLKWLIINEDSYVLLAEIIKLSQNIPNRNLKLELVEKLKKIISNHNETYLKKYKDLIREYFRDNIFQGLNIDKVSNIFINFLTILIISKMFHNFYYEVDKKSCTVLRLDLSDLELETKGLPFGWKNNIKSISEIPGLSNLKKLKYLDLSNNQIKNINELMNLNNLEELNLANNKLENVEEIYNLNNLVNLKILDLHGNKIVKRLSKENFKKDLTVIFMNYLEELEARFDTYFIKS